MMHFTYLSLAALLLVTAGPVMVVAGDSGSSARPLLEAGNGLRVELRHSANTLTGLESARTPDGRGILELKRNLLRADGELQAALKVLGDSPTRCGTGKLDEWKAAIDAETRMLQTLKGVRSQLPAIDAITQKLKSPAPLDKSRTQATASLVSVKKRLDSGLRPKVFGSLGRLSLTDKDACEKERAAKTEAARELKKAPLTAPPVSAPPITTVPAQRSSPAVAAAEAAPKEKGFFAKLWDGTKNIAQAVAEPFKSLWLKVKPTWLWKDKKDLSWRDPNLEWKKIDGDLFQKGNGDNNAIAPNDVNQGALGDCYYLASLAAVARQKPEVIQKMITAGKDGTYSVTHQEKRPWWKFWGPKYTAKTVTVDNEFPAYNFGDPAFAGFGDKTDGRPEIWTMVGEKAYAGFKGKGLYARIEGGFSQKAMSEITGRDSTSVKAKKVTLEDLLEWDSKGYAVTAHTKVDLFGLNLGNDPLYKDQTIYPGHAYYIKDIDQDKGTVTLGNPWGYKHATLTIAQFQESLKDVHVNPID